MGFTKMKGMLAVVAAMLVWVPGALAATPKEIYKDLADNGRLDKTYTQADMSAFLQSATVQGYGNPVVTVPPRSNQPPSSGVAGQEKTVVTQQNAAGPAIAETAGAGTLPFTGAELGLFALVGGVLLLGGVALRASARRH